MRPHRQRPPGSPIPGILQAKTLECVATSFSSYIPITVLRTRGWGRGAATTEGLGAHDKHAGHPVIPHRILQVRKCRGWRGANRRQHKPLALSVHKDIQTVAQTEQQNTSEVFNPQNWGWKLYSLSKHLHSYCHWLPLSRERPGEQRREGQWERKELTTSFIWIICGFAFCSFQSASK